MEVNKFKLFTHFILMLNLSFLLHNSRFKRNILSLKLINKLLLLLKFIKHVFRKLFSVIFANTAVLSSRKETTKVKSLLPNLSNGKIRAFKNSFKTFEKRFRFFTTFRNVLLKLLEFFSSDVVLPLRG